MTEATTTTPAAIAAASESLGRDMLDALMTQIEKLPGWSMASASTRELALRDFKQAVENTIQTAIQVIGTGQFPACAATLANVSFGADIRATLKIDRNAPGRHDLVDMAGLPVVILMASPDDYLARMQDVKLRSSQGDLFGVPVGTDPDNGEILEDDAAYKGNQETGGQIRAQLAVRKPDPQAECVNCTHYWADHATDDWKEGDSTACGDPECLCTAFIAAPLADLPESTYPPASEPLSLDTKMVGDDHILEFLRAELSQHEISTSEGFVAALTPAQRRVAWDWAVRKSTYPYTTLKRPPFLPDPSRAA